MGRLSASDEQQVQAIVAEARTLHLGDHDYLRRTLSLLRVALRASVPLAYALRADEKGPAVDYLFWEHHVPEAVAQRQFTESLQRTRDGYVGYQPLRPQPSQRNRVLSLRELPEVKLSSELHRFGLVDVDQLRVLLCEGDTLLAWVGAFRPAREPFSARERTILKKVAPAIRQRLSLERQLAGAPLAKAAIDAALEAVPMAAFIINPLGQIQLANARGLDVLETEGPALRDKLAQAIRAPGEGFQVTAFEALGMGRHHLVLQRPPPRDPAPRIAECEREWALTRREGQVIGLLALGFSNLAIAAELQCSQRTVEVHVTRALDKSGCDSRAQLIARFWSGASSLA